MRGRWQRSVLAGLIAGVALAPLVVMALGSLRPPGLPPPDGFPILPERFSLDTYRFVEAFIPVWRLVANSLIVLVLAVPVTVIISSLAGFAIATATPRRRASLLGVTVMAMLVPTVALWVPRFVMLKAVRLDDSLLGVAIAGLATPLPFYVLIFAFAYSRIRSDLFEAALLDGWSPLQVWRRVAVPLARSAAFAVAVLASAAHWANFVDPLLYISDPSKATLPLGLRALQTLEPANFPLLLAAAVVATIPIVILFIAAQRALFARTLEV